MLSDEQITQIRPRLRQVQIAAIGMMLFVLLLIPVVVVMADWNTIFGNAKMLTMIAAVGALGMFSMASVISKIFGGSQPNQNNNAAIAALTSSLSTESLIRFALLEGAVFLNLLVFMLEPHIASLVVAGIGLLMMLFFFPRTSRIASLIEQRLNS